MTRASLTAALATAHAGLRDHRASARILALLAGGAVVLLAPLLAFFAPFGGGTTTLRFSSVPAFGHDLGWTGAATTPAMTQQVAVRQLFELLIVSGLLMFAVAAGSMLLVAASIAGERAAELAVRRAVGASRRTLVAAALAEATIVGAVALTGGALTLALLMRGALDSWPGSAVEGGISPVVAAVAAGVVLGLAALMPFMHRGQRRLSGAVAEPPGMLVPSIQLGVALAVLTTAGIVSDAAGRLANGESSVPPAAIALTLDTVPGPAGGRAERYERLIKALGQLPGVNAVSVASPGQLAGIGVVDFIRTACGICVRGGIMLPWLEFYGTVQIASSDTFRARGFAIVAGRGFLPRDRTGAEPVAVVNRYLAARWFENGDAVGRDIFIGADWRRARHRVIGVVDDERSAAFGGRGLPLETAYLSLLQHPPTAVEILLPGAAVGVADTAAAMVSGALGTAVTAVDPAAMLAREAAPGVWFSRWFGIQGWGLLAAAVLGLVAFMRRWVFALAPEIALRRAAGATRRRMALFVGLGAARVAIAGAAVGLLFIGPALWGGVARIVPGASAWHPELVTRFAAVLILACFAAAAGPAWQVLMRAPARDLQMGE